MKLWRYIVLRVILVIPTLFILLSIVFVFLRMIGDPITAMVGMKAPPSVIAAMREEAGLNKPLIQQYIDYIFNILRGDFGITMAVDHRPVISVIMERFPATLELTIAAFIVSVLIGLITGTVAAWKRGALDSTMRLYSIVAYALFIPWFGLVLQLIFGVYLKILPIGQMSDPGLAPPHYTGVYVIDSIIAGRMDMLVSSLKHLILPSITLGVVLSGAYTRLVRNNMIDVMSQDFVLAYFARGIKDRKILMHSLKNAFIPLITMMGLQFAILLTGAILTETTFSWPGLGTMIVERIQYTDYTAVQGAIVFFALFVAVTNVVIDIIYAILDPRISY
jgi:peptide/nickel transport system permease protein